jgi:hypothetical protein
MLTLTYGFKKPQTGDEGAVVFPALETNWQLVNDHTHDGNNSAAIASGYITLTSVGVPAASWVLVANGHYTQNVTLPLAIQYDDAVLNFKNSTGDQVFPTVTKASATQVKVDYDDNSQTLTCYVS